MSSTITGYAWINPGLKDPGIICVVTIDTGFDKKGYIKYIKDPTNVTNDAIEAAKFGGKLDPTIAKLIIDLHGCNVDIKI